MARKQSGGSVSEQELLRRVRAILHGASAGPPTPLKQRKLERKPQRRRRQRKSRAA
jgi:hypothetical protein